MLPSDRTRRKQWCCLPLMMLLSLQLVNYSIGSPIFSNSMQFSQCKYLNIYLRVKKSFTVLN